MPILDVEIVNESGELLEEDLAGQLADIAGEILESEKGGTWVKVRSLPREQYAENGGTADHIRPVFVSVLLRQRPSEDVMKNQIKKLSASFARVCGRPQENIHILYLPSAAGRIAFGGELVT